MVLCIIKLGRVAFGSVSCQMLHNCYFSKTNMWLFTLRYCLMSCDKIFSMWLPLQLWIDWSQDWLDWSWIDWSVNYSKNCTPFTLLSTTFCKKIKEIKNQIKKIIKKNILSKKKKKKIGDLCHQFSKRAKISIDFGNASQDFESVSLMVRCTANQFTDISQVEYLHIIN